MDRKELYRLAISQELRSQNLYLALSKSFRNPQTSALFSELIMLEKTHEEKLRQAFAAEFPGLGIEVESGLAQDLQGLDLGDPQKVLDFAISREDKARQHYEAFAADTRDPELKKMLLKLAVEEDGHKTLLLTEMQRIHGALEWYDPSELNGFMDD
ncbi:MAG: ferritin family protein [Candidatus Syntrophosphaera sp.]|nr:ferritin family protein [Candidatus Syntrophosphaera sp.]